MTNGNDNENFATYFYPECGFFEQTGAQTEVLPLGLTKELATLNNVLDKHLLIPSNKQRD